MSTHSTGQQEKANALTLPESAQVRTSPDRAESIRQYIKGLLPSSLTADVEIIVTKRVRTAAVMPATEDELLDSEQADFDNQQAKQIVENVDADYLVFVTGQEANTGSICLSDQLTADTANQFGLAFHETLHILKTSFGAVQTLVDDNVDEQYHEFIHELINIAEDGAIEHEARTGDDFTDRAGDRLTLVRQIHSQSVDDLPDDSVEFSFGDALKKGLHDRLIFDTGVTDILLDDADSRVTFASRSEANAFDAVHDEIISLRDDILSMRSDHSSRLYDDDREASIQRAKRVIAFWQNVLKPIYEDGDPQRDDQQNQNSQGQNQHQQGAQSKQQQSQQGTPSEASEHPSAAESESSPTGPDQPTDDTPTSGGEDTETGSDSSGAHSGNTDSANCDGNSEAGDIKPEDLSLDTGSVDDPFQSIQSHPSIADEPDPDDVDAQPQSTQSEQPPTTDNSPGGTDDDTGETGNGDSDSSTPDDPNDTNHSEATSSTDAQTDSERTPSSDSTEDSDAQATENQSTPEANPSSGETGPQSDSAQGNQEDSTVETSSSSPTDLASHTNQSTSNGTNQQATFGDFTNPNSSESDSQSDSPTSNNEQDSTQAETPSENESPAEDGDSPGKENEAASGHQAPEIEESNTNDITSDDTSSSSGRAASTQSNNEEKQGPTEDQTTDSAEQQDGALNSEKTKEHDSPDSADSPAHTDTDLEPEDFASDRERASRTADNCTVDEQELSEDLQTLDRALGDEQQTAPDGTQSGSGSGPGSVSELTILPDPESNEQHYSWGSIESAADTVADTLAKQLRLDQQTDTRSGLSAGTTVNTKTAYRLGHNDPRTFTRSLPGDEKEYFAVIVLDRSGSMSPGYRESTGKIDIATSAVARFAVACEELNIDVAIIDFYDDEARYVKPPSVDAEFAQEPILTTDTAGGTPLSDALSLARTVADTSSKESLIISITDDKPDNVDAVETQIKSSYSPICSLTIATDRERGNPPAKAATLEKIYDQTATVFDAEQLDDRLDELATLLGAY